MRRRWQRRQVDYAVFNKVDPAGMWANRTQHVLRVKDQVKCRKELMRLNNTGAGPIETNRTKAKMLFTHAAPAKTSVLRAEKNKAKAKTLITAKN